MKTTKKTNTTQDITDLLSDELSLVVVNINKAILTVKKSQGTVFTLFKDAYLTLPTIDYDKVKARIDLHISSINKMEQIFKNEIVMGRLEKLPISWGTLSELALMDGNVLLAKIASGEINTKTTKDEASKIRKGVEPLATTEALSVEALATAEALSVEALATAEALSVEALATAEAASVEALATLFTFKIKETANAHKKEIKELIEMMEEYFEIPSNLEQFFEAVA